MTDEIRRATHDDIADLVRLNLEVQALHASHSPELFKPAADPDAIAAFFAEVIDKPGSEIGLLGSRGAAFGYIWFEHQQKPENPFMFPVSQLYVLHIAVSSSARRQGAGSRLMHWAEERAKALGAAAVVLAYIPANETARRLYERLGFVTDRVVLRKAI